MRKLIVSRADKLIVCDNEKCNFTIPYDDKLGDYSFKFINFPCPDCGENLLTKEDYLLHEKLIKAVDLINKWFSWITIFFPKSEETESISIHVHDGIKIEIDE
jgi:hypothetical protein